MGNRNFIIITVGRVLQIGVSLLAVRIFTSMLSTTEVGNLYLINSISAFFGFALLNPVGMYINRKLNKWVEEKNLLNQFFIFNLYVVAVSLSSLGIVLFMNRCLHVGTGIDQGMLLLLIMLHIYFNTWNQTVIQTLNLLDHRLKFVVFTLLTSFLGLGLSVFLSSKIQAAVWWLVGQCVAQIVVTSFAYISLKRTLGTGVSLQYVKSVTTAANIRQVLTFVAPLAFTTFLAWMQTQSYRMIVENRIGLEFLGLMGLGFSIAANIAAAIESIVQQVYFPIFYREIYNSDLQQRTDACNRMIGITIPLYLSLTLFVSCAAPFLVNLLAHNKFSQAYWFVICGAWIEMFRMITGVLSTAAHAEMQTCHLVKSYLVGGIAVAVGVWAGSGSSHYQQVIPGILMASGLVSMAVMYRDMKKILPIKVGISNIAKSAVISLPFILALLMFRLRDSMVFSLVITAGMGGYFLLTQYLVYRQSVGGGALQKAG